MPFVLCVSREKQPVAGFSQALLTHRLGPRTAGMEVVDSEIGGARLACLWAPGDPASVMWRTNAADGEIESLVYVSGWCYSLDRPGTTLTSQDFLEALDRHRRRLPPLGDRFSGNYVAVVFDRSCNRIAVQPDWSAMTAAYYGVADGTVAVSDRASSIAGLLAADIDGYSFLSLVEGMHPPFGRTLFSGVHRVLCGCYLEIDTHTAHCAVRRSAPLVPSTVPRTMVAAVSEMTQVMATMAGRILDSPRTVLDLTGGNDTRLNRCRHCSPQYGCPTARADVGCRRRGR